MPLRHILLCLIALALPAQADNTAPENEPWLLLEKAGQAAHKLNYKGIFVYQVGDSLKSMRITHMNYANGEFARIVALDGAPREILRQGNDVVIYNSRNEKVLINKRRAPSAFPAMLPGLSDWLKVSYQVRLEGEERVGGRDGVVVALSPRDQYRYGYRFAVDREFGLLLQSVMLNEQRQVVEKVAFSQLTLMDNSENMDWFRPEITHGKTYEMQPEETMTPIVAEGEHWTLAQLPPGYRKVEQVRRELPGRNVQVDHLVFSDGLASVSLFIEALGKNAAPKLGEATQGPTNVYASVMDGHQIIVVGEVPQITVRKIAEAVSFNKK